MAKARTRTSWLATLSVDELRCVLREAKITGKLPDRRRMLALRRALLEHRSGRRAA